MSRLPDPQSLAGEINALTDVIVTYLLVETAPDDAQREEMLKLAHAHAREILGHWRAYRRAHGQAFWLYDSEREEECPHDQGLTWMPSGARCKACHKQVIRTRFY